MKLFLTVILLLAPLVSFAQAGIEDGNRFIEHTVSDRYEKEGTAANTIWKRPWRIVILFNSAQAENKSAYTDAGLQAVRSFLSSRAADGQPHRVWFFPYQLDLYQGADQAVIDVPLNADAVNRIERVFPRVHFKTMSDGTTPYPAKGGHSNIAAREQACQIIGRSSVPTLLVQLTDVAIGEAPGQGSDEAIRRSDQRLGGVESAGLVPFDAPESPLQTSAAGQTYSIFLYGPTVMSQGNHLPTWVVPLCATVGVSVAAFIIFRLLSGIGGPSWSVTLTGNASIVLTKGEKMSVYGPRATPSPGEAFAMLNVENAPAAKLFEAHWTKEGVRFLDHVWEVRTPDTDGSPVVSTESNLTCRDKITGKSRLIHVNVIAVTK